MNNLYYYKSTWLDRVLSSNNIVVFVSAKIISKYN
jgi:hypothetical protein